jgi:hypothetical protein
MPEHDADEVGRWERWQLTEPLRLHLYGITVPLLGLALVYGWVTTEQAGAWLAVAGALFIGSTVAGELARRKVNSPDTLERELDRQHRVSYSQGVDDALKDAARDAHPETAELGAVRAQRCRFIENGRRCVLDEHGKDTPHHYG